MTHSLQQQLELQLKQNQHHFASSTSVAFEIRGDLLCVLINNGVAQASIALQGAHVYDYQVHGRSPLLWLSPEVEYRQGVAIRGGVPVCWPWFGDLAYNPGEVMTPLARAGQNHPAHGWARTALWQLDTVQETSAHSTQLEFVLPVAALPPVAGNEPGCGLGLRLSVTVAETLTLALTTHNDSSVPLTISQALHSYFAVEQIDQVALQGFDQCPYYECLADWRPGEQRGDIHIAAEVDRVYHQLPHELTLVTSTRDICLQSEGSCSAVVWNPWIDKSQRLSHFPDDGYQTMVCIETANAMDDCVTIAPGQRHTLAVVMSTKAKRAV